MGDRERGLRWCALFFVVVVTSGCAGERVEPCACQSHVRDELEFESQSASGWIDWGGDLPIVEEDPPPDHTCLAALAMPEGDCSARSGPPPTSMNAAISCTAFGRAYAGLSVSLGDIRDLPVGKYPMHVSTWGGISGVSYTATLHVESSAGGSGEFPRMVSEDFAKSLRLELVSGILDASLEFALRAEQFHAKPNQKCKACYC
jgi:hypothetical protein